MLNQKDSTNKECKKGERDEKNLLVFLAGLLVMTVVGCGTARGFGEDSSTVDHWITRN